MNNSIVNHIANNRPKHDSRLNFSALGSNYTYCLKELYDMAGCLAQRLIELGLKQGDTIGILAANSLEWVLLDLAAIRSGIVTAGFDPGKFEADINLIEEYNLQFLFTDKTVSSTNSKILHMSVLKDIAQSSSISLPKIAYSDTDITTIKFTSGSTGLPKGLEATVGSTDASIHSVQTLFNHNKQDNLLIFLPLSLLQQRYWIYSALYFGHEVTISTYQSVWIALSIHQPTVVMGVPAFYDAAKNQIISTYNGSAKGSSLKQIVVDLLGPNIRYMWTGSAPATPETLVFFNEIDMPIFEGYGMNETCIVSKNYPEFNKTGSVGKLLPHKKVTFDEDRVIYVHSEYPVNNRYLYCEKGASKKLFIDEGVVRTGDIGFLDDEGYLYIEGRADDTLVLKNGKKIKTQSIETKLKVFDEVHDAVVLSPDDNSLVAVISPGNSLVNKRDYQQILSNTNKHLEKDEQMANFIIASEPFSIENGLLTSQYKPIRKKISERYKEELNNFYVEETDVERN